MSRLLAAILEFRLPYLPIDLSAPPIQIVHNRHATQFPLRSKVTPAGSPGKVVQSREEVSTIIWLWDSIDTG